jgi:glycine cleavage system aminomethyltransferase T
MAGAGPGQGILPAAQHRSRHPLPGIGRGIAAPRRHGAVARECRAVRSACGLFDASTLGKIEVVGPDAAEFMNRLYINNWSNLAVGRSRYGILLREDGFIYDDGVLVVEWLRWAAGCYR